ncbi:MAG: hypothetical protein DCF25_18410 [Leptolyngbya foveolarum]|uniref:Uncharacterized protein n=1 Tax=Leptolyngbya foveolarum TaxID=47253 RepID=A0A2W4TS52_9CYAN|nr:MAG: hypothetical protein DCF25_18410 [Leptolyngbya foveolarum]
MKRFMLSLALLSMGAIAFAPAASAASTVRNRQVSSVSQLPEGSTLTDLVQHNRDARGKK